uniref:BPTI/Kunitz inhibitor domain-containing protein n=2 Tax=Sus scrofa TaxID=9823 RepID=A0A8D1KQC4_PIG
MVKHTQKLCVLDRLGTTIRGLIGLGPSASWLDTQALTVQLNAWKGPVLTLGVSGLSALKYQAQNKTSVDTETLLLAAGCTMKSAELGYLLGLFIFFLLTTPLMGGVSKLSQMICGPLQDPCNMDVKYGSCFEIHFRFFFNKTSRTCEYFIYSGCDGNLNNYKLRIECQLACMKIPTQESGTMQDTR